ncbi:MAG: hypothetical protein EOM87_03420, partial [Clostridia bacterium]|nr:hypothetical protein [Clostridia bacterium]
MKKYLLRIAALVVILAIAASFIACDNFAKDGESSYVRISINPEVEFAVNENNVVEAVNAANEDAEVLLSDTDL